MLYYVEIKGTNPNAVALIHQEVENTQACIILSSFHHAHLQRSKQLNADIPTMALLDWEQAVPFDLIRDGCVNEIGVGDNLLAETKKNNAQMMGVPSFVYTVNAVKDMEKFKRLGFAGVFTDTF